MVPMGGGGGDGSALAYLLKDIFTTDLAAGSVNSTAAEPGPGTRGVTDANSKLSLSAGLASFATGGSAEGNPRMTYATRARTAGRMLFATMANATVNGLIAALSGSASLGREAAVNLFSTGINVDTNSNAYVTAAVASSGVTYTICIILRAIGAFYFVKGGAWSNWTLTWWSSLGATATLTPGLFVRSSTTVATCDAIAIPDILYVPQPLANDAFTRADGALGNTGGGAVEETGGTGLAWTDQQGTWAITSNAAGASALASGVAIATVDTGKVSVLHEAKLTRGAGVVGIVLRYVDSQNYIIAYHDGTNAKLDKVVAGVTTNVLTGAATYSAGAAIRVTAEAGSPFHLFYNNAKVGGTGTINDAGLQTSGKHGIYTTDTGNTIDGVATFVRGVGGEWGVLDNYFLV